MYRSLSSRQRGTVALSPVLSLCLAAVIAAGRLVVQAASSLGRADRWFPQVAMRSLLLSTVAALVMTAIGAPVPPRPAYAAPPINVSVIPGGSVDIVLGLYNPGKRTQAQGGNIYRQLRLGSTVNPAGIGELYRVTTSLQVLGPWSGETEPSGPEQDWFCYCGNYSYNRVSAGNVADDPTETLRFVHTGGGIGTTYSFHATWSSTDGFTQEATQINISIQDGNAVKTFAYGDPNPTASSSVRWNLEFFQPVAGLTASNFVLQKADGLGGTPQITSVTGSGTSWTVTATTGTGNGNLTLILANSNGISPPLLGLPKSGPPYDFRAIPIFTKEIGTPAAAVGETGTMTVEAVVRSGGSVLYEWYRGLSPANSGPFNRPTDQNNCAKRVCGASGTSATVPTPDWGDFQYWALAQDLGSTGDNVNESQTGTLRVRYRPSNVSLAGASVEENKPSGTLVGTLSTTDQDVTLKGIAETFTYSLVGGTGAQDNAAFAIQGDKLVTAASLNYEDPARPDRLRRIRVRTTDSFGLTFDKQLTIAVIDVNDAPVLQLSVFSVDENVPTATVVGPVGATDEDSGQTLTYEILAGNTNGAFLVEASGSIKVANAAMLDFETTPTFSLSIKATDNGAPILSATNTITINLRDRNDPPVLVDTEVALAAVVEDAGEPAGAVGTLVSTLVGGISDPDANALKGIAIVETNSTNGTWWYSTDNGASWTAFDSTAGRRTRFLAADDVTRIAFQPRADWHGAVPTAVTFRAWDRVVGTNGSSSNTNGTGAISSSISFATDTASVVITPVADTPTITDARTTEDTQTTSGLVVTRSAADGAEVTHVKVTGIVGGALFLSDGTTPVALDSFVTYAQANAGFRFTPQVNGVTNGSVTVRAATSGADAGLGGSPATATISVGTVNDSPTASNLNQAKGFTEGATIVELDDIVVADPDAGDTLTVTLQLANVATGRLTAPAPASYVAETGLWSVTGTVAAVNAALASVAFEPNVADPQSATIAVTVRDAANSGPGVGTIAITATLVNETPTSIGLSATTVAENSAPGTVIGTLTTTDPDPRDTHTYSLANDAGGRFAVVGAELRVASGAALNFEAAPSHDIVVRSTDAGGLWLERPFTVTLTNQSEAPTAAPDAYTTGRATPLTVLAPGLLANDADPNGRPLTAQVATTTANGTLMLQPNGAFLYTPNAAFVGSETFTYRVGNGDETSAPATVTIEVTPVPSASVQDIQVNEGAGSAAFSVALSGASTTPVTVTYATTNETSTAPADYQPASGTLTFAPGETTKPITVTIVNDPHDEPTETFALTLTAPVGTTLARDRAIASILDDDGAPTLSVQDVATAEGNTGRTSLAFVVTLAPASGQTVTVRYATAAGTATAGADFEPTNGTLTFAPGETSKSIGVPVIGDQTVEPHETLTVALSDPTNAAIGRGTATGTISNDDTSGSAACTPRPDVGVTTVQTGPGTLQVTLTARNGGQMTNNRLHTIQLLPDSNATIDLPAGAALQPAAGGSGLTGAVTLSPANPTQPLTFTVRRRTEGAFKVQMIVVDTCGDWQTFVGGGAGVR